MTTRWSVTDYIAKLPDMPLAELCARLRGEYADATYGKHPLHAEAARRLEAMQAEMANLLAIVKGAAPDHNLAIARAEALIGGGVT